MNVGIIGNFGGNGIGGQITKTRELYHAMVERYGYINKLDVYRLRGKYWQFFRGALRVLLRSDNIIIILGDQSYFKVQPMLLLINFMMRRKLYNVVIGGIRVQNAKKAKIRICCEKRMQKIYVETKVMEMQYKELGLENVTYLPNFKNMHILSEDEVDRALHEDGKLRVCVFSRIDSCKGIDTAVEIVQKRNLLRKYTALDIIGPIDESYKAEFNRILKENESPFIHYLGEIDGNAATEALKKYDCLLFPTRWATEGFPGTFLDAMAAGLPIISSDHINFHEIIRDGYNGYLIKETEGTDGYIQRLTELQTNGEMLLEMKKNSLREAKKYTTDNVLKQLWKDME